ncbi:segregation/condensation protein A [uncultured Clostridium sp.]|jgi:segregation and condensation protein A|uniref:segregation/condensation protein A n=1 Tax=uncultured Clostridium sp. TaxID=59620 RepID=UPI0026218D8C|nr:segregation/condensation protein A [uncultured Clostridium sp.]
MKMPKIKISNFDGPFDLLIHLIKKNEMDITDIRIEEIINQYLDYISLMQELDLEITSEFIVMAATLIEIKSKSLLPKEIKETDSNEIVDLETELKLKLIEYTKFKKISDYFKKKDLMYGEVFTKKAEIIELKEDVDILSTEFLNKITMRTLYTIYINLIQRYNDKQNTSSIIERNINVDKYKVNDKIKSIRAKMKLNSIIRFSDLSYECECKLEVVVTFLAILEMIKLEELKIMQYDNFEEIIIEKVEIHE